MLSTFPAARLLAPFVYIVLLGFAVGGQGLSVNHQKIRPLGDPIWADLEAVLLDAGRVELSPGAPYADSRLLAEVEAVDPAGLSAPAQLARLRILSTLAEPLRFKSGVFGIGLGLEASPGLFWRSSKSIPWLRGYSDRPPLAGLPIEFSFADSAYGYSNLSVGMDAGMVAAMPGPGFGFNFAEIVAAPMGMDGNFPLRSIASLGGDWWNLEIGRDKLALGSQGKYNLTLSTAADFYDFGRLSLFSKGLGYTALMIQLNPQRNLYVHRIDMRFGGALSFGMSEGLLVGEAPPELRYLNPFMIFHGYEPWHDYTQLRPWPNGTGSEVGMELNWSPLRWFSVTAQYAMTQFADPLKRLFWPQLVSEIPDGEAFLAGFKLRLPLEEAFIVATMTAAYTTPLAYILTGDSGAGHASGIAENPTNYLNDRPNYTNYPGADGNSRSWIGFSEGPDTELVAASIGLDAAGSWGLLADLVWKAKGERAEFSNLGPYPLDWPNYPALALLTTPTGVAEYSLTTGLSARSALPPLPAGLRGSAEGALHWTGRWNARHAPGVFDQSWELGLSTTFSLR